ncbi:hypothetical protein ACKE5C_17940 [Aneurinibacillus thermoaerophilus]|uniref:Uncharacterized protein n=1 Tax=Aneurinibacillus thermoaerophilus TaxID=143495 RepID=A0ABX8YAB5_ANETH|nr:MULTISPECIES: hypothetical protein [Aneurinibacillus]AMA71598.1 hypothetical protein ACH33_01265 [Aneurinibacillus sp. XH2]MED0678576.1 hypothetical protein [Aneurinibacillus thermoaerophilus]QYY42646.1 hypothetical protein K3F53_17750 [Aneurinibacillus thermoaerophilus]
MLKKILSELQSLREVQSRLEKRMETLEAGQNDLKNNIRNKIDGLAEKILEKLDHTLQTVHKVKIS